MADELKESVTNAHNEYRAKHEGTPSLVWSEKLAEEAQEWANKIAELGTMKHSAAKDRKGQGENLACCKGKPMTGAAATGQWYSEIKDFDFTNKVFHHKTGHFTQAVWKASLEIGAALSSTDKGWNFCVARYAPAGNLKGAYDKNIGDLLSEPQDKEAMDKLREELQKATIAPEPTKEEVDSNPNCQKWKDACLKAHNDFRAKHEGTGDLIWSDTLAWEAQKWANKIAANGKPAHAPAKERPGQGENLACGKGKIITGASGTGQWYAEIKDFDFTNKIFHHTTGHFSQVIWKECKEVGAGAASSADGWNFVVARYSPAGNVKGKFDTCIGDLKE